LKWQSDESNKYDYKHYLWCLAGRVFSGFETLLENSTIQGMAEKHPGINDHRNAYSGRILA
jgi:hypothetical protein